MAGRPADQHRLDELADKIDERLLGGRVGLVAQIKQQGLEDRPDVFRVDLPLEVGQALFALNSVEIAIRSGFTLTFFATTSSGISTRSTPKPEPSR
ncbi:hypothetical protein OIU34_08230 [Pararhizobium sp. BT-229]|uniref:hypothetical protein n=1 Tax=Pararhizobium sp. BT-229 TaxID=2986923 RepID=UPI0021F6F2C6|nr:hypothetical protein [Pararhizobium sp. BT-229]MCV9961888.1 hypothetical protein [Pararhizobium sp. BT-229]